MFDVPLTTWVMDTGPVEQIRVLVIIKGQFCLFLHKKYSLELPCRGDSNEYSQHMFYGELTKIIPNYHQIPFLSVPMDGT